MSAREPREAKTTAAAARRVDASAAAGGDGDEVGDKITFDEMRQGYEAQIGSMSTLVVQQNIMISKLQKELTQKREPSV
jgi:hypothetical protein